MKIVKRLFNEVVVYKPFLFRDERGTFVKTFHKDQFTETGLELSTAEEFYSTSKKNVIRGFHFQVPPYSHKKLIYCTYGRVLDVVVDLRINSPTYGICKEIELSASNNFIIYIGVGFGHAFLSLEEMSCLVYKTDCMHAPDYDFGLLWNSFDYKWPTENPQISVRDSEFIPFSQFKSPFTQ